LEQCGDLFLVAHENGRLIGTLLVGWDGWRGNMYRLAVLPEFRRQGVASALVEEAERRLRAKGARRITALVISEHEWATEFWRAAGYDVDERMLRFAKNL
jgi:ribosomal protein S18 acetylase RimI-like enzyme